MIVVGGAVACGGNITPAAEFNIYCDAESARDVLRSRITKTLLPLDVSRRVMLELDVMDRLKRQSGRTAAFLAKILPGAFPLAAAVGWGSERGYIHDVVAVVAAMRPELFTTEPMHGDVETCGELSPWRKMASSSRSPRSPCHSSSPMPIRFQCGECGAAQGGRCAGGPADALPQVRGDDPGSFAKRTASCGSDARSDARAARRPAGRNRIGLYGRDTGEPIRGDRQERARPCRKGFPRHRRRRHSLPLPQKPAEPNAFESPVTPAEEPREVDLTRVKIVNIDLSFWTVLRLTLRFSLAAMLIGFVAWLLIVVFLFLVEIVFGVGIFGVSLG